MFLEQGANPDTRDGWIEVICGCMFSGKTEELIRRMRRAEIAKQSVMIFKPQLDTRYHETEVVSHDQRSIPSIPVGNSKAILDFSDEVDVIGIDEAQFFDADIVEVATELANEGKRVIIAGLDLDFRAKPFGSMPNLMAVAEYVTKVHAICQRTGNLAHYSFRFEASEDLIKLGHKEVYEPVSRRVFYQLMKKKNEE